LDVWTNNLVGLLHSDDETERYGVMIVERRGLYEALAQPVWPGDDSHRTAITS